MKLWVRLGWVKNVEVESSDSLRYSSHLGVVKLRFPEFPWTKKNIHIVEYVCRFVYICPGKIQLSLS